MKKTTVDEVGSTAKVARMIGVARTTLDNAIRAGYVETRLLGDSETRVVVIASAQRWVDSERKPGPKPTE